MPIDTAHDNYMTALRARIIAENSHLGTPEKSINGGYWVLQVVICVTLPSNLSIGFKRYNRLTMKKSILPTLMRR